jgi:hypothetical protein
MAPRRGGGGGYHYSIGGSNQCAEADAFSDGSSIGYITIQAIFLFATFVLTYLWLVKKKNNPQVKAFLPAWSFGIALFFLIR